MVATQSSQHESFAKWVACHTRYRAGLPMSHHSAPLCSLRNSIGMERAGSPQYDPSLYAWYRRPLRYL